MCQRLVLQWLLVRNRLCGYAGGPQVNSKKGVEELQVYRRQAVYGAEMIVPESRGELAGGLWCLVTMLASTSQVDLWTQFAQGLRLHDCLEGGGEV